MDRKWTPRMAADTSLLWRCLPMLLLLACVGTKMADSGDSDSGPAADDHSGTHSGTKGNPPEIRIITPLDGDSVRGSLPVGGFVKDQEAGILNLRIKPDPAGSSDFSLWQPAAADGTWYFTLPPQEPGPAVIEVECEDTDGEMSSDQVAISVNDEEAPLLTITSPAEGAVFLQNSPLALQVEISDDQGGPWELTWSLSNGNEVVELGCDGSSGSPAGCAWITTEGSWELEVSALSADLLDGEDRIHFQVVSPENYDDDGDGYTEEQGDCDDGDASITLPAVQAWRDEDEDGYGAEAALLCDRTPGYSSVDGDCDDAQVSVHTGAAESCDGLDNDCNGLIDDNAVDFRQIYLDGDADGEGAGSSQLGCPGGRLFPAPHRL